MAENIGGELFGALGGIIGAINQKKAVKQANKDQLNLIKSLDWSPTTTAQLAPTYQRSQSPVARSYLESFLLGNNPDAVMPGDPMAEQKRRQMQYAQNQQFGTPQQRVAQEQAYRATTPWAIDQSALKKAAEKQERSAAEGEHALAHPKAVEQLGLDAKLYDDLARHGAINDKTRYSDIARHNPDVVRSLAESGQYDEARALLNTMNMEDVGTFSGYSPQQGQLYAQAQARAKKIIDAERKRMAGK